MTHLEALIISFSSATYYLTIRDVQAQQNVYQVLFRWLS